jgi:hypothetical protein
MVLPLLGIEVGEKISDGKHVFVMSGVLFLRD